MSSLIRCPASTVATALTPHEPCQGRGCNHTCEVLRKLCACCVARLPQPDRDALQDAWTNRNVREYDRMERDIITRVHGERR